VIDATALGIPETFNVATHFVDRHVREGRGAAVAIECGDERVTYAQLLERVNRFGAALRGRLGVRAEERVVLLLLDGPAFAYSFFGAIKIGAVPIPTNTLWKAADYQYVLNDACARVLVVSAELLSQIERIPPAELRGLRHIVVVGGDSVARPFPASAREEEDDERATARLAEAPEAQRRQRRDRVADSDRGAESPALLVTPLIDLLDSGSSDLDPEPTSRDAAAFWLYSSGSTGRPKGCVHLQHDMVICAELFAKGVLGARSTDRFFSVAKLFFAYGLGNALYFPLAVGGTSILCPGPPTPANVYGVIEKHRPTLLFSVPTSYGMLLAHGRPEGLHSDRRSADLPASAFATARLAEAPEARRRQVRRDFDLSSVRLAVSAGEALPPALYARFKQRFGVDIVDGIGSTETLHMFISNRPNAIRPGSSGLLVDGYDARLLDDERQPVPAGEIGHLWINGDSVCSCYWNQHEKTKHTIEGPWIRTGDKYSRDADGFFWFAGRTDDMLKVGGLWVSPVEVENALVEHAAVQECGVVAREDRDALVKPAAFVVLRSGVEATPELANELKEFVRARLAEYKRPRWVEFVAELPKTATGKIQRFKLREISSRA
jgi:benzoate-CoA ligase